MLKLGEFGPGLTLDRILGGAALCGIGFTISLFIVDIAIDDALARNDARVGVLTASVIAFVLATIIFRISDAVRQDVEMGQTLARPVDPARDHLFGDPNAPYTIVEYGDFQCGFCLKASGSIQEVVQELGDQLRYVWRHAPLTAYHPNALAGAEASEAASLQGKFFEFERGLFADQENQRPSDIIRLAREPRPRHRQVREGPHLTRGDRPGARRHAGCRGDGHHGGSDALHQRSPAQGSVRFAVAAARADPERRCGGALVRQLRRKQAEQARVGDARLTLHVSDQRPRRGDDDGLGDM